MEDDGVYHKNGEAVINIVFHRIRHRRDICRILDMVLELGEGLLDESDFQPGGEFALEEEEDEYDEEES